MTNDLRDRWDRLRPYQREVTWAAVFGMSGLALFALLACLAYLAWPSVLESPNSLPPLVVVGGAWGLASGIGGLLLGYRIEDRRGEPMPPRFEELASYNAARARGVTFDQPTTDRMAGLQSDFNCYIRRRFILEHSNHTVVESDAGILALPKRPDLNS